MLWTSPAKKGLYVESAGKKACAMGYYGKGLEFWSYPLKLVSDLQENLFLPEKKIRFDAEDYGHVVEIRPHSTMIRITHPLVTMEKEVFTPLHASGSFIIYRFDSSTSLEMVIRFSPALNLMWPGSIGGQDCLWYEKAQGFALYEPTRHYSGLIRMDGAQVYSKIGDHAFSDEPYQMVVSIPKGRCEKVLSVFGVLDALDQCWETVQDAESHLKQSHDQAKTYYEQYLDTTVDIQTPDAELNRFFSWSKISLLKGEVDHPQLGKGLVAGIGPSGRSTRPGFDWFFAGDMAMNSLGMVGYNDFPTIRDSLVFYARYQKEDGRIPHEISQSAPMIDWFSQYAGFAYLHADTTAYFLLALANYTLESGDSSIVEELGSTIEKALQFCKEMSEPETGLILNQKAGLGALEIGEFRKPKYDIYTNSIWAAALDRLAVVYQTLQHNQKAQDLHDTFDKVCKAMEAFWWEEGEQYCLSIMPDQRQLQLLMAMTFFPISFDLLNRERSQRFLQNAKRSTLWVPWGVRSIVEGPHYDPIHYNFGSIWYFFNGFFSKAAYTLRDHHMGYAIIHAAVKALIHENTTHMPELFSGDRFTAVITAVPHQLFSLGPMMWAVLSGMLGIRRDAMAHHLYLSPQYPMIWEDLSIRKVRFGDNMIDIHIARNGTDTSVNITGEIQTPFSLSFEPLAPLLGTTTILGQKRASITLTIDQPITFSYTQSGFHIHHPPDDLEAGSSELQPKLLEIQSKNDHVILSTYGYKDTSLTLAIVGEDVEWQSTDNQESGRSENGWITIPFHKDGVRHLILKCQT